MRGHREKSRWTVIAFVVQPLLVAAALAGSCPDVDPAWSSADKILFRRDPYDFYTMAPDGSARTFVNAHVGASAPEYSPDGTKIAYTKYPPIELWVMSSNGTGDTKVTTGSAWPGRRVGWSPDSQKIVFPSVVGTELGLFTVNVDGTGLAQITTAVDSAVDPSWSADGSKIAFVGEVSETYGLYTIAPNGTGETKILDGSALPLPHKLYNPAWSPDGTKIVFEGYGPLYVVNANGSGLTQIVSNSGGIYNSFPHWSPDGQWVTFDRGGDSGCQKRIYKVKADGTSLTQLTGLSPCP